MEIICRKCSEKYEMPDLPSGYRRFFFYCKKCGHRVVIDRRGDEEGDPGVSSLRTLPGLFEGVPLSFNAANILIAFLFLLVFTLFLAGIALLVSWNLAFFRGNGVLSGVLALMAILLCSYLYASVLYFISKNVFQRMKGEENFGIGVLFGMWGKDQPALIVFSIALLFTWGILLLPPLFLEEYGIIYGALLFPALAALAALQSVFWFMKNLIPAFLAQRTRSFRDTVGEFFEFLRYEAVNIPVYIFAVSLVTVVVSVILLSAVALGTVATMGILSQVLEPQTIIVLKSLFAQIAAGSLLRVLDGQGGISYDVLTGAGILLFFIYLQVMLGLSYSISLQQSLASLSVHRMETVRGRSLGTVALVLFYLAAAILLLAPLYRLVLR